MKKALFLFALLLLFGSLRAQDTIFLDQDTIRVGELEWDLEKDWESKKPLITTNKELYGDEIKIYHSFYKNRAVEQIAFGYQEADNFVPHGPTRLYYPTGEILGIRFYKKGYFHGESRDFHKNGRLQNLMFFQNDEPVGEYRSYHENGKLESLSNFEEGLLQGREQFWYSNGRPRYVCTYDSGWVTGADTTFYESGALESVFHFKDDLEDSLCTYFHRNGVKFSDRIYEEGKLKEVLFLQDDKQKPLEPGSFKDGYGNLNIYSDAGKWIGYERYKAGYMIKYKYFRKPK